MLNTTMHKTFAEEVLESMTRHDICSMVERRPRIFYIGSNDPGFLLFFYIKPWESYRGHALDRLGSAMHAYGVNAFYETAIEYIRAQKHEDVKELTSVYLFGHLRHWVLDKTTHPYVFYRTGNCRGVSAGLHRRLESMMDTVMPEKYRDLSIRDYPCYEVCACDKDILKAITRIYVPAVCKAYHHEVEVYDIREILNSWYNVQKLLYGPTNIKYSLLKGFETPARKPWTISGNVVRPSADERYDVLNEEYAIWKHPCDDTITSNASFIDMLNEAIEAAVRVVDKAYGCIEYGAGSQPVLELLQDVAYDTGMNGKRDMKYFDIIYDRCNCWQGACPWCYTYDMLFSIGELSKIAHILKEERRMYYEAV